MGPPSRILLVSIAAVLPASGSAQQIEVLRSVESETVAVGPDADRASATEDVEVVFGIDPERRSADFETLGYDVSSDERRTIHARERRMIELYRSELGVRVPAGFRVDLAIHGSGRPWQERAGALQHAAGLYDHATREAFVAGRDEALTHRTALHESSHAVLMHAVPQAPAWLNEGLAEYFAGLELSAGATRIARDGPRHALLARLVETDAAWPLEALLAIEHRQWLRLDDRAAYLAYGQSWSIATFLMESETRRSRLRRIVAALGRDGAASEAAIERYYPGGVERLDRDWRTWLRSEARTQRF